MSNCYIKRLFFYSSCPHTPTGLLVISPVRFTGCLERHEALSKGLRPPGTCAGVPLRNRLQSERDPTIMNVLLRNGLAISPKLLHRDPCRSLSSLWPLPLRTTNLLTLTRRQFPLAFARHSQPHTATPSESVLSFVPNKVWNATHRSRIPPSHGRPNPFNQPPRYGFWQRLRERLDSVPTEVILYGILVLNGLVFGAWQLAWSNWVRGLYYVNRVWIKIYWFIVHSKSCAIIAP